MHTSVGIGIGAAKEATTRERKKTEVSLRPIMVDTEEEDEESVYGRKGESDGL